MAYNDALFQLGMDLARGSSTAQKEDHAVSAHGAQDSNRADDTGNRDSSRTSGNQLIIDLVGAKRIDDLDHIESALKRCVESAGGTLLHVHLHRGEADEAITGVGVLSQGTISFRSWPKRKLAVVDVLGNGHTVLGHLRGTPALVENRIATSRAERALDRTREFRDPLQQTLAGLIVESHQLCHSLSSQAHVGPGTIGIIPKSAPAD